MDGQTAETWGDKTVSGWDEAERQVGSQQGMKEDKSNHP